MGNHRLQLLAILLAAIFAPTSAPPSQRTVAPVIRQVDHILVETGDPQSLFDFFSETLQLPVAWPIADYQGFTSGGVAAGNVNIEIIRSENTKDRATRKRPAARFLGIALEPFSLARSLPELASRGIPCGTPQSYVSKLPDGSQGTSWTTVSLPQYENPSLSVFLCEYNPKFLNVDIRRTQLGGQLVLSKGGPLGIAWVKEIVLGTTRLEADRLLWRNLLLPTAPSWPDVWLLGNGPALRLVSSAREGIQGLLIRVESLGQAREFLEKKHLLGKASSTAIQINPARIQGLNIRLIEN